MVSSIFPMALVAGRCTPNDYARGAMAAHAMLVDVFHDIKDDEYKQSFEQLRSNGPKIPGPSSEQRVYGVHRKSAAATAKPFADLLLQSLPRCV